jgi:crotonobetainyl-CoA:carnitine CoA-transferase CaiB-like acyl-CoA transferase
LEKVGVPCAPINDITVMQAHPQTAALNILQTVPEHDLTLIGLPLSFDGERPRMATRAPKLGQHNSAFPELPPTGKA